MSVCCFLWGNIYPIVPLAASEQVINLFKTRGAQVEEVWVNDHEITETGLTAGQQLLGK